MTGNLLNIYKIIKNTEVEGPGRRFCIWTQGCSRHCKGCFAKQTWEFGVGKSFTVDDLWNEIKAENGIEGITLLGGEPFEQAQALSLLAQKVKETGLSVMTFSGNSYDDLKNSKDIFVQKLLKYTDLLVDGEFREDCFDLSRPWVGSKNQRYIFLSGRYSLQEIMRCNNKIELHIDKNGVVFVNGMTDFKELKKYLTKNKKYTGEKLCLLKSYQTL